MRLPQTKEKVEVRFVLGDILFATQNIENLAGVISMGSEPGNGTAYKTKHSAAEIQRRMQESWNVQTHQQKQDILDDMSDDRVFFTDGKNVTHELLLNLNNGFTVTELSPPKELVQPDASFLATLFSISAWRSHPLLTTFAVVAAWMPIIGMNFLGWTVDQILSAYFLGGMSFLVACSLYLHGKPLTSIGRTRMGCAWIYSVVAVFAGLIFLTPSWLSVVAVLPAVVIQAIEKTINLRVNQPLSRKVVHSMEHQGAALFFVVWLGGILGGVPMASIILLAIINTFMAVGPYRQSAYFES